MQILALLLFSTLSFGSEHILNAEIVEVQSGTALESCLHAELATHLPGRSLKMIVGPIQDEPSTVHYVMIFEGKTPRYKLQFVTDDQTGWKPVGSEVLGYSASRMSSVGRADRLHTSHCTGNHDDGAPMDFSVDLKRCFGKR